MTPTRRGLAVCGVAFGGFVMAAAFGARSLNAVVVPGLVGLLAAVVQLWGLSAPTVTREVADTARQGQTITVRLHVDADDPFRGTVHDAVTNADEEAIRTDTVIGAEPLVAEVTCRRRGEMTFGPVEITATDVLGLLRRRFVGHGADSILVYPRVRRLDPEVRQELVASGSVQENSERESFDRLREYDRGDTLRDVNWKASAKREELIVTEYGAERTNDPVTIAAGGADADGFAEATASIAADLLQAGVPVQVRTPEAAIEVTQWNRRHQLFGHLARVGAGQTGDGTADVIVNADGETTVTIGGATRPYADLIRGERGSSGSVGEYGASRDELVQEVRTTA